MSVMLPDVFIGDDEEDGEFGNDEFGNNDYHIASDDDDNDNDNGGDDEITSPILSKQTTGARTIFVTQQFRSFEDEYVKLRSLGDPGQFGTAFECYSKKDSKETRRCVKEINKARFHHISVEARNEILKTMQNEITTLTKVDHPNIVKLYDVYEDRHFLHLVMEYLSGGELFARIVEKDSFCEKEAANVLKQILEALDHMHDKNILHLDLKPDNILYANESEDSPIKLIDFGMARVVPRLAKLKDRVGTPTYMAPEVWNGKYSKAADVWSVGVILFCMLFGFPPFYADTGKSIHLDEFSEMEQIVKNGFDPTVKPDFGAWFPESCPVSDNCRHVISKMLDMDVASRWTVKECLSSQWVRGFCSEDSIPPIVRDALRKFHGTCKFKVAISNIFVHQLDQDHVAEIKRFFNDLDDNNDGAITLQEFKNGMKNKFHTELSDAKLESIFSTVDLDDDRTITFEELITITTHRMLVDEDERMFQAFAEIDENGDGVISKQELENAMRKINRNSTSAAQGKQVMQRMQTAFITADRNQDGNIDYEEFLRILHPDFGDNMDFASFKNPKQSTRYRGQRFDVTSTATTGITMEPERKISPESGFASINNNNNSSSSSNNNYKKKINCGMKCCSMTPISEGSPEFRQDIALLNEQIRELQAAKDKLTLTNEELNKKVLKAESECKSLRLTYDNNVFSKLETQSNEMSDLKQQWKEFHDSQIEQLYERIQTKDDQIHKKDLLVIRLNESIEKKNMKLEKNLHKFTRMEQKFAQKDREIQALKEKFNEAVQSKMRSLETSNQEIAKLKEMLSPHCSATSSETGSAGAGAGGASKGTHIRRTSFGIL